MFSKNNSEIVQKNIFILPFATPRWFKEKNLPRPSLIMNIALSVT